MTSPVTTIVEIGKHEGQAVTIRGWLYNLPESGKLLFPIFRDGSGIIQGVVPKNAVPYAGEAAVPGCGCLQRAHIGRARAPDGLALARRRHRDIRRVRSSSTDHVVAIFAVDSLPGSFRGRIDVEESRCTRGGDEAVAGAGHRAVGNSASVGEGFDCGVAAERNRGAVQ